MDKEFKIRDCNKCPYLYLTEDEQQNGMNKYEYNAELSEQFPTYAIYTPIGQKSKDHICTKQDKRVYHRGMHPILPAYLNNCPLVNYREKQLSEEIVYNIKQRGRNIDV